ncbi:hypothetical protein [Rhizobium lusitanum]|uniref:Uncharacterized protein n=1 Tax=Rhizobium lusitanum TaxID=293958 RepID=A0A7X0IWT6_9HYPH|nr:hypothetical protein [Rhizobium lusitanum]MBB6487382.1 hypothetical protein [Rhizobium lusitanum]
MTIGIISRLKTFFGLRPLDKRQDDFAAVYAAPAANFDREPSARDYELYYWCATPAPWY